MTSWKERYGGAAVVTGASSGIGQAFARALASRGMDVVLVARRSDRLETLAKELRAAHRVSAVPVAADLSRPESIGEIEGALKENGLTAGLLVNNAGFGLMGPFEEQDPAKVTAMVEVNCRAPIALARSFSPGMVARGRGGIIFVASTAAYQPSPYLATYGATKGFDLLVAEALWAELAPKGVDVLGLSPGYTETEFQDQAGGELASPGGTARPEDVVETALAALGQKPSVIHGFRNAALATLATLAPRAMVAKAAARHLSASPNSSPRTFRAQVSGERRGGGQFERDVVRMIATFLAVSLIDVVVGSLLTGKFRFWFPNWIDASWATRPDARITYSQSYISGIFFIPFLAASAMREFLPRAAASARTLVVGLTIAVLAFIVWWKGGLMIEHHKEREAVGWLALTAIVWGVVRLGENLPRLLATVTPRDVAARVAGGVATFFLVMAVLDPMLTVAVQGLPWSKGLFVEMGFFIPAGVVLAVVAARLRGQGAHHPVTARSGGPAA